MSLTTIQPGLTLYILNITCLVSQILCFSARGEDWSQDWFQCMYHNRLRRLLGDDQTSTHGHWRLKDKKTLWSIVINLGFNRYRIGDGQGCMLKRLIQSIKRYKNFAR